MKGKNILLFALLFALVGCGNKKADDNISDKNVISGEELSPKKENQKEISKLTGLCDFIRKKNFGR